MYVEGGRQHRKNPFLENSHRDITVRAQYDKDGASVKIKVSYPFTITQQQANCLRYAHSQHIESHLGKKQPHAKIPIAFLFGKHHFNNVTSDAPIFHGGHYLVMRSN